MCILSDPNSKDQPHILQKKFLYIYIGAMIASLFVTMITEYYLPIHQQKKGIHIKVYVMKKANHNTV